MTELEKLARMHSEIESLFYHALDHIHADMLHEYLDDQQIKIDRLRTKNERLQDNLECAQEYIRFLHRMYECKTDDYEVVE